MRGRKPIPTNLHALRGTLRPSMRRRRQREPKAEGDLTAAPLWMTEGQRQSWDYAIANAPRGVLRAIDRGMLAIWVEAEDRHRTAAIQQVKLDRNNAMPLLTKDPDGVPVPSPYLSIITKAAIIMLKAASELGFSPASRPRIAAELADMAEKPGGAWAALRLIPGGKGDPAA